MSASHGAKRAGTSSPIVIGLLKGLPASVWTVRWYAGNRTDTLRRVACAAASSLGHFGKYVCPAARIARVPPSSAAASAQSGAIRSTAAEVSWTPVVIR